MHERPRPYCLPNNVFISSWMLCALYFKGKVSWACWEARYAADINNSSKGRIHIGPWETGNQQISPLLDWLFRLVQARDFDVFLRGLWEVLTQDGSRVENDTEESLWSLLLECEMWLLYSSGCNWLGLKTWMEYRLDTPNNKKKNKEPAARWLLLRARVLLEGKEVQCFSWEASCCSEMNCLSLSWGTDENSFKWRWVNTSKRSNELGKTQGKTDGAMNESLN